MSILFKRSTISLEQRLSVGSVEVHLLLLIGRDVREVDGQVSSIGLGQIIFLLGGWNILSFISGNEDDSCPISVSPIVLLRRFVLEELYIGETIKESVSSGTHNNVLFISDGSILQFFVLLVRECLDLEVVHVVIFLTLDQLLIILFECILVR